MDWLTISDDELGLMIALELLFNPYQYLEIEKITKKELEWIQDLKEEEIEWINQNLEVIMYETIIELKNKKRCEK